MKMLSLVVSEAHDHPLSLAGPTRTQTTQTAKTRVSPLAAIGTCYSLGDNTGRWGSLRVRGSFCYQRHLTDLI